MCCPESSIGPVSYTHLDVYKRQVYVTEPDGIQYFYCGNTRIRVSEHFSQAGKPMDKLIENVIQYAARNAG